MISIIKRCTINVTVTQNNLAYLCFACFGKVICNGLQINIVKQVHMNIFEHSIITTVISRSASKPYFNSSHDLKIPFLKKPKRELCRSKFEVI